MRLRVLILGLAVAAGFGQLPARAVEITASGISLPFFNETGTLTHKILARQGTKAGNVQNLRDVEVLYFSATDPGLVVQKLEADEAMWDDRKETLTGSGRIVVVTAENRLSGEGFDFALATSLLHIHRQFKMTNPEVAVTSDRATVELLIEKAGDNLKVRDVKRCEASGHLQIVVQPPARKKFKFDEAYSESATYDGATKTIRFPRPALTLSNGHEVKSNTMTIRLGEAGAPPLKSPP